MEIGRVTGSVTDFSVMTGDGMEFEFRLTKKGLGKRECTHCKEGAEDIGAGSERVLQVSTEH